MKTQFDFFANIVALQLIIIALGVTKILEGFSWIVTTETCVTYWVHTLGSTLIVLLLLQYAWTSLHDYTVKRWTFGDFLLQCATPMLYLFVAGLLFPNDLDQCDLKEVYRRNIRVMAALVMVVQMVNSVLDLRYHPGESLRAHKHIIRCGAIVVLGGLMAPLPHFQWLHEILVAVLFGALLVFCLRYTPAIETG